MKPRPKTHTYYREPEVAGPACPRCHLRGPHICLSGSGADRDAGKAQYWAKREHHHKFSNEESRP